MIKAPVWLWAAVVLSALIASFNLSYRYRAEADNRAVGLLVEAGVLEDMAAVSGESFGELLARYKLNGLTGVALTEQTIGELCDRGALQLAEGEDSTRISGSSPLVAHVRAALSVRLKSQQAVQHLADDSILVKAPAGFLRSVSVGINPVLAAWVSQVGLEIVARHGNGIGYDEATITWLLTVSKGMGAKYFLPSGDQVLGSRKLLPFTRSELRRLELYYVTPEFVKITGDASTATELVDQTVRLHSIQAAEIDRMDPASVFERYGKAFRERNIRWLLVRPMTQASEDSVESFGSMLQSLAHRIGDEGGAIKAPRPFTDPGLPKWAPLALALVSVVCVIWLGMEILPRPWSFLVAVLSILLAVASYSEGARNYYALVAALAFPIIGYVLLDWQKPGIIWRYLILSGFSLVGGLVTAGMLVDATYMIHADQFSGVKVAQFLPIFVVGALLARQVIDLKAAMKSPIYWGTALLSIVGLVALLFMMGRSGNDNPASVSGLELKFRAILDQVLYTRPRTKEFLIGHPALIVGLGLLTASLKNPKLKGVAAVLLIVGMVGQTSIVNTMCHLHTPLDVSLSRIVIGVIVGGIIGAIVWVVVRSALVRVEGNS